MICPQCGKVMSKRRLRQIERDNAFAVPAFAVPAIQPADDSFYRDQAIQQAVEKIAFFWAGNAINDNTAWGLIRRLVPDAHAADMAAFYGAGVAARREWGLVPVSELWRVPLTVVDDEDDDDDPEAV